MNAAAILLVLAQLSGTVRDAVTRLPVSGARVNTIGPVMRTAISNDTGGFSFDDLPPGPYRLDYSKQGYQLGQVSVDVKSDGDPVSLSIAPYAEVSGVVRDEDGKPLPGVFVYIGGLRDTTDKEGRYHAKDIADGSYGLEFRLPYELRRKTAVRDEKRGETFGHANTLFYPGVADRKLAGSVAIAPGARMDNFDIRLRRERLVELKGRVVGGDASMEVELEPGGGRPDEAFARRKLDAHGGFRFDLLTPSNYILVIHRNRAGDDLPYLTTIALGEAGREDLEVVLPPFVDIAGTVRTARSDMAWEGPLRVMLGRQEYNTEVRVGPEGQFVLHAIPPGEWSLTVDSSLVRIGGATARMLYAAGAPDQLRVFESGNPPIEITLSDETARISGTSEVRAPVIVVTAGRLMFARAGMRVAMPQSDGSFSLEVPPGEYRVGSCTEAMQTVRVDRGETANVRVKRCAEK